MGSPYVGEIRMFGGNFAPAGWAFCQGQLIPISENDVLFNLIGTTYGGDGQETFGLPDLQGRAPMHVGNGHVLGEKGGVESVTLTTNQIPVHTHAALASTDSAAGVQPTNNVLGATGALNLYHVAGGNVNCAPNVVGPVGGNQPHENMQSFLVISFIIALFGVFPTQN